MRELCAIMDGWPLALAADLVETDYTEFSRLRRGQARRFSLARPFRFIACRGYNIEVRFPEMSRRFGTPPRCQPFPSRDSIALDVSRELKTIRANVERHIAFGWHL